MTAEVVTMNKGAAAMAADSAITIIGQKVYNSGSKLFPLSKAHPVGIMFYGNAAPMGVPWETIIAEYREHVASTHFDSIQAYGTHFLKFLAESKILFPPELQKRYLLETARWKCNDLLAMVNAKVTSELATNGQLTDDQIEQIVIEVVLGELNSLESAPFLEGCNNDSVKEVLELHKGELEGIVRDVFQNLPLAESVRHALLSLGPKLGLKEWIFNARKSGVVICGFGGKEIYPSVFSVELESIYDGKVKCFKSEMASVSDTLGAYIRPFAQSDVAMTFLRGIDPNLSNIVGEYLKNIFGRYSEVLPQRIALDPKLSAELKRVIDDIGAESFKAIEDEINGVIQNKFINPVLGAVQVLPKDELASMAETLVSLTSFRRRMSFDVESVGGPIDVAVISKKDGFIWIKRKHYFKPELNPHYFERNKYGEKG